MKRIESLLLLTLLAVFVLAGGCSDDNPVSTESLAGDANAAGVADDAEGNGELPRGGPHHGRFGLPGPLVNEDVPEGGTYDPASGWFVVPPEADERGAIINRSYAFFDADGATQEAYDEDLTASIGLRFSLEAHPAHGEETGTIRRSHDLVVSNLVGSETSRVWNGTMESHSEGVPPHRGRGEEGRGGPPPRDGGGPPNDPPDFSELVIDESSTIEEVTVPFPLGEETWPLSGEIVRATRIEGGRNGDEEREGRLEFNGTRYATLTIDGETKEVDLSKPPRRPPQR
ncbi:MAG: hypothetical protein GF346_11160 [Candidatus Eisenbacteria bacterium]|nr:hypothetical protein [Candidatus Latescibacterota bacterium]MBD3302994.1 hypothetical protein [Candidatus Eisenbacteria bacterium]